MLWLFTLLLRIYSTGGDEAEGEGAGEHLTVTYEDGDLYWQRLDEIVAEKGPSDSSVGDFLSQLKERTKEKRTARYEKARRRRRMLVDQGLLAAKTLARANSSEGSGLGLTGANLTSTISELTEEQRLAAKDAVDEENRLKALERQAEIEEAAETSLIQFCETIRASTDLEAREQQRQTILKAREVTIFIVDVFIKS